jgi:hypothetical protein
MRNKEGPHQIGCTQCLEKGIGNDIISRFYDAEVLRFTGKDYREQRGGSG